MIMSVPLQLPQQPKTPPPLLTMALVTATKSADHFNPCAFAASSPALSLGTAQGGLKQLAARPADQIQGAAESARSKSRQHLVGVAVLFFLGEGIAGDQNALPGELGHAVKGSLFIQALISVLFESCNRFGRQLRVKLEDDITLDSCSR
jgi:hypothetical protein